MGVALAVSGCSSDEDATSVVTPEPTSDAVASTDTGNAATDAGSSTDDTSIEQDGGEPLTPDATTPPQDSAPPGETPADVHRALLASLAEHVIVKTYTEFLSAAEVLVTATAAFAANPDAQGQLAARDAFSNTMDLWQRAEVLQIGPAGSMTSVLGGQDLRDEIYSWPSVNPCRVDQEVVEQAYADLTAFAGELTNVRGLDALEYLLYPPEIGNGCKASSSINKNGDWETLIASGELDARRASYSATVASLLAEEASGLVDLWTQGDGTFSDVLGKAGKDSDVYETAQDGMNAISDAMFYVEKITKDMKLAMPAGISGCEEDTCPGDLESQHAHRSAENVAQNIIALQALFLGTYDAEADVPGFDDLLIEMGAQELAQDMTEKLAAAREVALNVGAPDHIGASYGELLGTDPQRVVDVHVALKAFTDLMKTEFVSTLDLALPTSAAGDND